MIHRKSFYGLAAGLALVGQSAAAQISFNEVTEFISEGQPVALAHAGDDRLFVTIQQGDIWIVDGDGNKLSTPFLSIRSLVLSGGERGLLSAAFHPEYDQNGYFYVNYTRTGDGATVIARYQVSAGDPNVADSSSGVTLMVIPQDFSNHNGGQLQFGPDGYLYIGMGDGGSGGDPNCRAQSDDSLLGKMLRLDVDQNVNTAPYYGIPAGNPHIGAGDPADEIWARGLRNPWRFSFDRATGDLWIADVGQNALEEVNHVPFPASPGLNFGWKIMEGTNCFGTSACTNPLPCNSGLLTDPVHVYARSIGQSVTGGYVYRGPNAVELEGLYVFADFSTRRIWTLDPNNGYAREEITQRPGNIFSFGEDAAGNVYVLESQRVYLMQGTPAATSATQWQVY